MKSFLRSFYSIFLYIPLFFTSVYLCTEDLYKGIFLLFILTLWLVIALKTKSYKYSIFFVFFLLPFNITLQINLYANQYVAGFFVNYLLPTISILDVFVGILLIQIFIEDGNLFKKLLLDRYLLIYFVLVIVQNLFVHNLLTLLLSIRMCVYLFTSILLLKSLVKESTLLRNIYVKTLVTSSILLQGVLGILQFLRGSSLGLYFLGESKVVSGMFGSSYIDVYGESYLRAYGTFPHPNILAGWFLLMFFICIYMYRKTKEKVYILNIFFIFIFTLFTFSRVSIILLSVCVLILLFKYFLKSKHIYSISSLLFYRFLNIFNGEDSSWSDRLKLLKLNLSILKENILGVGLGNSIKHYSDNIPFTEGGTLLLQPVHNIFILNWVEQGVFIGTYYIYVMYRFFIRGLKLNTVRVLVLISIIVIGIFDHYLFSLPQGNAILFSFLILLSDLE